MKRPENYNTKQREAVLAYIISLDGVHVTAAQIVAQFRKQDVSIGRTTIYRHLDKLVESGQIRRYTMDGISGACYQYVSDRENCGIHLHLKCDGLKRLAAIVLLICFIMVSLLSEALVLSHANYDHSGVGDSCAVCVQIQSSDNLLKQLSMAVCGMSFTFINFFAVVAILYSHSFLVKFQTPVELKTQMNN